jgi:hypothetical protein
MRTTFFGLAVIAALGPGCALDAAEEPAGTTAQELTGLGACFTDLGQYDPSVPLSRRFDSGCSTPSTGSYIAYRTWDFGDGGGAFTGGTITDHVFAFTNSCYKVHLTVWDANGQSAEVSHNELFCSVSPCNPVCPT